MLYPVIKDLLDGPAAPVVSFLWGMAEALFWPIIPDYFGVAVIPASPQRWWTVALWLTTGSIAGGIVGYWFSRLRGTASPLESMPLVTPTMIDRAGGWLSDSGALGIFRQPFSGVPYKVFVYLGGSTRLPFGRFVLVSALARGARIWATSAIAGGVAQWSGTARVERYYDLFIVVFTLVFAVGLYRVVRTR